MTNKHSTENSLNALPLSELLQQTTQLCNELDELITMHHFFYQAAEHFFGDKRQPFRRGLSLLPDWLREQDLKVQQALNQIQAIIRAGKHADDVDPPS